MILKNEFHLVSRTQAHNDAQVLLLSSLNTLYEAMQKQEKGTSGTILKIGKLSEILKF